MRRKQTQVLVLEDNPADAFMVREALEDRGEFRATLVDRLADALARLGRPDSEVEVMVVDLSLPDIHGVEVVDRMRAAAPRVPLVVYSGRSDRETALLCLELGARDFLVKGKTTRESLARAVARALERETDDSHARPDPQVEERERRRRREIEQEEERVESLARLSSGVAHRIGDSLTVVLGYAGMLLEKSPEGSSERSQAMRIREAGRQAAELMERLLAYGTREARHREVVSPCALVEGMTGRLVSLLPADVVLEVAPGHRSGCVMADPTLLELAVTILVEHARDAVHGNGRIRITTLGLPARAASGGEPARRAEVAIKVTDTGPGLDDEARKRLFDPFYTAEVLGIGSGLGLAPVQGIARQHDGRVDVRTTLGEGDDDPADPPLRRGTRPRDSRGGGRGGAARRAPGRGPRRGEGGEREDPRRGGGRGPARADPPRPRGSRVRRGRRPGPRAGRAPGGDGRPADRSPRGEAGPPGIRGAGLAGVLRCRVPGLRVLYLEEDGGVEPPLGAFRAEPGPWLREPFEGPALARSVRRALDSPVPAAFY